MVTRSDYRGETAVALLGEARACLEDGELLRASEKGWDAAAYVVEAIAEDRGWAHAWEGDLFVAIDRIVDELGDARVRRLFLSVSALQQNFYEGWMGEGMVADALGDVEEFIRRLDDAA